MSFDPNAKDLRIGVVGADAAGRGLVQLALQSGCRVSLFAPDPAAAAAAVDSVRQTFARAAEKGQIPAEVVEAVIARAEVLADLAGLAVCRVVFETYPDRAPEKLDMLAALDRIVAADATLVTLTSGRSVTALAAISAAPERIVGLHLLEPFAQIKVVEVIDGLRSDQDRADKVMDLTRRLAREPVRVADTPGFIVGQLSRGYTLEAAHIAAEGAAPFEALDRILREGCGFRTGPFELMDEMSLDAAQLDAEQLYREFFDEPRYRPTPLMRLRLDAGLSGRSIGRGFYDYGADGNRLIEPEGRMPHYDERWVWVSPEDQRAAIRIKSVVKASGGVLDENKEAHPKSLLVVTPLGEDATSCATRQGLDPERTVAIDSLFGLVTRRTVMKTAVTKLGYAACGLGLFGGKGAKATLVHDTPGFVAQRIIASIINIACAVAQSGVATPEDIDKAAVLGLTYPKGPLAWGDEIGAKAVLRILNGIHECTGDPRYRPTPWLRRRAQIGVSLLTPDS